MRLIVACKYCQLTHKCLIDFPTNLNITAFCIIEGRPWQHQHERQAFFIFFMGKSIDIPAPRNPHMSQILDFKARQQNSSFMCRVTPNPKAKMPVTHVMAKEQMQTTAKKQRMPPLIRVKRLPLKIIITGQEGSFIIIISAYQGIIIY